MNRKLGKNLILITRVVMFCLGAIIGFIAMWQFFVFRPSAVEDSLKIVFYIVSGLFAALILFFSAKPVLYLIYAVGDALKKAFGRKKPLDVAGIFLGVAIGIMLGYLTSALMGLFVSIVALNVTVSVVVGLVTMYIAILLCTRWLYGKADDEDVPIFSGYILTESALKNVKIVSLSAWLNGNIVVLSSTLSAVMEHVGLEGGAEALQNYHALSKGGGVKTVSVPGCEDEKTQLIKFAEAKGLKLVCQSADEYEGEQTIAPILALDTL